MNNRAPGRLYVSEDISENDPPLELDGRPADTEARSGDIYKTAEVDAAKVRGTHRFAIALALMIFVGVTSGAVLLGAFFASPSQWIRVERASEIVLAPLLTLLGAAVGWYFADKRSN